MTDSTQDVAAQDTTAAPTGDVQTETSLLTPGAEAQAEPAVAEQKPEEAPKPYEWQDFQLPEGVSLDTEATNSFKSLLEDSKLSLQEKAQGLLKLQGDLANRWAQEQQQAALDQSQKWVEQVKSDKEIGGEHFQESMTTAIKAVERFTTPELRDLLNASGLGNHPELVRAFVRIGKAISEDASMVIPGTQVGGEKSLAERLWGSNQ